MRISCYCAFGCTLLMLSAVGMAFGQDTNFATGPQYLTNSDPTNPALAPVRSSHFHTISIADRAAPRNGCGQRN